MLFTSALYSIALTLPQVETWDLEPARLRDGLFFGTKVVVQREMMAVHAQYDGPLAPNHLSGPGAVHLFHRDAYGWTQFGTIDCPDPLNAISSSFGRHVEIGDDVLVVSDPQRTIQGVPYSGTLWSYGRAGGAWTLVQQIHRLQNLGYGAFFGMSGDRLAVSSSYVTVPYPSGPLEVGAVDIYERQQGLWTLVDTIMPVDLGPRGLTRHFGLNVQCQDDILIAGCDLSSVYHSWDSQGEVRIFEREPTGWRELQVLQRPTGYLMNEYGKCGLALDGEWIMVGDAPLSLPGPGGGSVQPPHVYAYRRDPAGNPQWTLFQTITPSVWFATSNQADRFGFSVALDSDRLVVGAPYAPGGHGVRYYGQAWVFEFDGTTWVETQRLTSTEVEAQGHPGGFLGWSVDVDGPYIVAGDCYAPAGDPPVFQIGKAYVYENGVGSPTCVGAPNNLGVPATLTARGSSVAHVGVVDFFGGSFPPSSAGALFVGANSAFVANPGGSAGNLCVGGAVRRLGTRSADAGGNWTIAYELPDAGTTNPSAPPITPGTTWHFQTWYRQPGNPVTSNFTGAVAIQFE